MTNPASQLWFVFNELSARATAESHHEGHQRLDGMVHAVAQVMVGRPAELVSIGRPSLWETELAAGYTVTDWCATAEPELRQLLLGIAIKTEFPEELGSALEDRFHLSEFRLPERPGLDSSTEARSLGAAYLQHGVGVSLLTEPLWKQTRISLRHFWLDDDCCPREDTVEVLNLSGPSQAEQVSDMLVQRHQQALANDPLHLAVRKNECFPHLSFGLAVDSHLGDLPLAFLRRVVQKFMILDDACRNWRRDRTITFPEMSDCRGESEPTMDQYGDRRIFPDAEGRDRVYKLHIPVGSYRIHFRVVHQPRGIEIGYVGKHLPTVRHH